MQIQWFSPTSLEFEVTEMFEFHIPKGSYACIDICSVHMNRKPDVVFYIILHLLVMLAIHWGLDVNDFEPERFI
jgi:hypothetical protein